MGLDPSKILPLVLILTGMLLFFHDRFILSSPLIRIVCQFFSYLLLTIGFGWSYAKATGNPTLKILDWALVGLILCMMPIFEILSLLPWFWVVLVLFPCVVARFVIVWWMRRGSESSNGS